jgi:hypothetical protein
MWLIQFNGEPAAITEVGSLSADSGNRLASIEPTVGISLLLQVRIISSSVTISAISQ